MLQPSYLVVTTDLKCIISLTHLEALQLRQSRLWCHSLFLCSVDLKTLHHILLDLVGLR